LFVRPANRRALLLLGAAAICLLVVAQVVVGVVTAPDEPAATAAAATTSGPGTAEAADPDAAPVTRDWTELLGRGPELDSWRPEEPTRVVSDNGAPPVVVRGSGWGHSVGMSQYGAQAQALAGRTYREILGHYYQGVEVTTAPPDTPQEIRVNLFLNQKVDASHVAVQTSSRDGSRPTEDVTVDLGGGPVAVPFPERWTITGDGADLVLVDREGNEQARGAGPARVAYDHADRNPTLLRLPQLVPQRRRTRLAGTYQWGALEVTQVGDRLRPVMVLPLELYLRGLAEMPSGWHPEALKAQAIAGRNYAVRQVLGGLDHRCGCHLGATAHHQVYAGWSKEGQSLGERWRGAVEATTGEVATHQGELAWTYYSSSHGGRSEAANHSWAYGRAIPYLQSVDDSWSQEPAIRNPYAAWERVFPNGEFAAAVGLREVRSVEVLSRTEGGTPVELQIVGVSDSGQEVVRRYNGPGKGIAGSVLKLHFRSKLPSQQITEIEVLPPED
jgi:SpoIID/LytB domain protein